MLERVLKGRGVLVGALAILAVQPAYAEVVAARADGFQTRNTVKVKATPDKAYAALLKPGAWWSSDHTWSGKAANMTLEGRAGGCFCEALANGGSVQHAQVVYADPAGTLRLVGGLGPLQGLGMAGTLTWTVKAAADGGSEITQTYLVSGYMEGGAQALAPAVDQVLAMQARRLGLWVDTGKPEG